MSEKNKENVRFHPSAKAEGFPAPEGYNVPPEGGITEARKQRDFFAEIVEIDEPVNRFRRAYIAVQDHFINKYKFPLFLSLSVDDEHNLTTLHVPITQEQKELDEQILGLAKVTADSLNKKRLDAATHQTTKGSIEALENFVSPKSDAQTCSDVIEPFRVVQGLRSTGAAHRKGERYSKSVQRYSLANLSNSEKFVEIIKRLTHSLELLTAI
jgi:hypothetical protein